MKAQLKPGQARICNHRQHSFPLVIEECVCPDCHHPSERHPEADEEHGYCVDCAEGPFPADQLHVLTYQEEPYMQIDDGDLICICLECKAKRDNEEP